jgi:hypothetical protein
MYKFTSKRTFRKTYHTYVQIYVNKGHLIYLSKHFAALHCNFKHQGQFQIATMFYIFYNIRLISTLHVKSTMFKNIYSCKPKMFTVGTFPKQCISLVSVQKLYSYVSVKWHLEREESAAVILWKRLNWKFSNLVCLVAIKGE